MTPEQKFRVIENGLGRYALESCLPIPGDIDGGTEWVHIESYDTEYDAVNGYRISVAHERAMVAAKQIKRVVCGG